MSRSKSKRAQNKTELRIAEVILAVLAQHNTLMLELLLQVDPNQWKSIIYGDGLACLNKELTPIASKALKVYGLHQKHNVEDATQRIMDKILEGRCFKKYAAMRSTPKIFILGCARNLAKTIARSIWRASSRDQTNHDWLKE